MIQNSSEKFVASNEGLRLSAYPDPAGVLTIGYGTTIYNGEPVKLGLTITQSEAELCLHIKCDEIKMHLFNSTSISLNDGQIDALVDFCYNLGFYAFLSSTLYKIINNEQSVTEDMFTRWDKVHKDGQLIEVKGLKERRQREFLRYSRGD